MFVPPPVGGSPVALRPPSLFAAPMLASGAGGEGGQGAWCLLPAPGASPGVGCSAHAPSRRQGPALALHATWAGARLAPDGWQNPREGCSTTCWGLACGLAPALVGCSANARHWRRGRGRAGSLVPPPGARGQPWRYTQRGPAPGRHLILGGTPHVCR